MTQRSGRFRVYRVVPSVPHLNLQAVDEPRLYTVYESGYESIQNSVDTLRTGDLIEATISGDPTDDEEAWRLTAIERVGGVRMDFAVNATLPAVADTCWESGQSEPQCVTLTDHEDIQSSSEPKENTDSTNPIGACCVQPRAALPDGAFIPNILTGTLPLESVLQSVPGTDNPAVTALFIDPARPNANSYEIPFGVVLLFTQSETNLRKRFYNQYDCPIDPGSDIDTRPSFDPYAI